MKHVRHIRNKNKSTGHPHELSSQLVAPQIMRNLILSGYHSMAHIGASKLFNSIREHWYWNTLAADCKLYCATCQECTKAKRHYGKFLPPLQPRPITYPMERLHIDIIYPLKKCQDKVALLTIIDSFTRFPHAIPLSNTTSIKIAEALFEYFCMIGTPHSIVSDLGSNLQSEIMTHLFKFMGITRIHTSAGHSSSNSMVERLHSTLWASLRCHIDKTENWVPLIGPILWGLRSAPCSSSGISPFTLFFGRTHRLPIQGILPSKIAKNHVSAQTYIDHLIPKIDLIHKFASEQQYKQQVVMKNRFDKNTIEPKFEIGDQIYLHNPSLPKGLTKKMHPKYNTKYYIVARDSETNYRIRNCDTHVEVKYPVHCSKFKLVNENRSKLAAYGPPINPNLLYTIPEESNSPDNQFSTPLPPSDNSPATHKSPNTDNLNTNLQEEQYASDFPADYDLLIDPEVINKENHQQTADPPWQYDLQDKTPIYINGPDTTTNSDISSETLDCSNPQSNNYFQLFQSQSQVSPHVSLLPSQSPPSLTPHHQSMHSSFSQIPPSVTTPSLDMSLTSHASDTPVQHQTAQSFNLLSTKQSSNKDKQQSHITPLTRLGTRAQTREILHQCIPMSDIQEVTAVKNIDRKKHYKVIFTDPNRPTEWINCNFIPSLAIQRFHIARAQHRSYQQKRV